MDYRSRPVSMDASVRNERAEKPIRAVRAYDTPVAEADADGG